MLQSTGPDDCYWRVLVRVFTEELTKLFIPSLAVMVIRIVLSLAADSLPWLARSDTKFNVKCDRDIFVFLINNMKRSRYAYEPVATATCHDTYVWIKTMQLFEGNRSLTIAANFH